MQRRLSTELCRSTYSTGGVEAEQEADERGRAAQEEGQPVDGQRPIPVPIQRPRGGHERGAARALLRLATPPAGHSEEVLLPCLVSVHAAWTDVASHEPKRKPCCVSWVWCCSFSVLYLFYLFIYLCAKRRASTTTQYDNKEQ